MKHRHQKKQRIPLTNNTSGGATSGSANSSPSSSSAVTATATSVVKEPDELIRISKALSKILRHRAVNIGLSIGPDGYVDLDDILKLPQFGRCTRDDIEWVVKDNDKQRFALRENPSTGKTEIRANQGHSLDVVKSEDLLERIEIGGEGNKRPPTIAVHGTYIRYWDTIKKNGLCRMQRNHIHFASEEFESKKIISGMRSTCEVLIYLNVDMLLKDNIPLFRSGNDVILCEGIGKDGILPVKYFSKVIEKQSGRKIFIPEDEKTKEAVLVVPEDKTKGTVSLKREEHTSDERDTDDTADEDDWEIVKLSEEDLKGIA